MPQVLDFIFFTEVVYFHQKPRQFQHFKLLQWPALVLCVRIKVVQPKLPQKSTSAAHRLHLKRNNEKLLNGGMWNSFLLNPKHVTALYWYQMNCYIAEQQHFLAHELCWSWVDARYTWYDLAAALFHERDPLFERL